jgi:hypothetical protein
MATFPQLSLTAPLSDISRILQIKGMLSAHVETHGYLHGRPPASVWNAYKQILQAIGQ